MATGSAILVVEDDPHFGQQLVDLFSFLGHRAELAADANSALDRYLQSHFDLVLSDVMLPGMNGFKFVRKLRSLPEGRGIPVLLMSAVYRDPGEYEEDLADLDVLHFLTKPFSVIDLGRKVTEMLKEVGEGSGPTIGTAGAGISGRMPTFTSKDEGKRADGDFDRRSLLRLFCEITRERLSGCLSLEDGRTRRDIFFVDGHPVAAESDHPDETLPGVLVQLELLDELESMELQAQSINKRLTFQEVALRSGRVRARRLYWAERQRVRIIALGGFEARSGRYRFEGGEQFEQHRGFFEVNPTRCLVEIVARHFDAAGSLPELREQRDRLLRKGAQYAVQFPRLELPPLFDPLPELVASEQTIGAALELFVDDLDAVAPLLWLMLQMGVLVSVPQALPKAADLPEPGLLMVAPSARQKGSGKLLVDPTRRTGRWQLSDDPSLSLDSQSTAILTDYLTLMRADLYYFLGVPRQANPRQLEDAYERKRDRYNPARLPKRARREVRSKAKELLSRLVVAYETLTDPRKRSSYDQRIEALDARDQPPDLEVKMSDARAAMKRGRWGDALLGLRKLRRAEPYSADVLGLLGWCLFLRSDGMGDDVDEARRWVRRALELDPKNRSALRYQLQIARGSNIEGDAREPARQLERAYPGDPWLAEGFRGEDGP